MVFVGRVASEPKRWLLELEVGVAVEVEEGVVGVVVPLLLAVPVSLGLGVRGSRRVE